MLTCPTESVLNPMIAPISPVITTIAAVSEGIPPNTCVTSIAIGVVTDLLASDINTVSEAPSTLAMITTLTIPAMQPTICDANMGKNFDAAVMTVGQTGFGLGAVPTAMANMQVIDSKYGSSPSAFFIVPLVGSLFINLVNSAIITVFLNIV